jgi:DNA-binding CsgD family transcriptional regulator
MERSMKNLSLPVLALIAASLLSSPLAARQLGYRPPSASSHVLNRNSLSAPATSPLQQQMQQNYATQLTGAQRDLLQQNPSGLGRQEIAIGHELNGYTGPR